jgi:anthranilate synthase component 2
MIIVIDNYDSFTYNLVQYIGEFEPDLEVHRNNKITVAEVIAKQPTHIVISPGPCTPTEAGISVELIKACPASIPLLGVCLGHQALGQAFGGNVIRAPYLMHGKVSQIFHSQDTLFKGIPSPFIATRYHSLIVEKSSLPDCLKITAHTQDDLIMGLEHKDRPLYGMQFHPESIMTEPGKKIISNFLIHGIGK